MGQFESRSYCQSSTFQWVMQSEKNIKILLTNPLMNSSADLFFFLNVSILNGYFTFKFFLLFF